MTLKQYHGSCHCGAVRYEARIDLANGTNRCNCSLCSKGRAWFCFVPGDEFRIVQGDDQASEYRWTPPGKAEPSLSHRFCSKCGIRLFAAVQEPGGSRSYGVHVSTLDDVDREELKRAPLHFLDGAHDRFDQPPDDTSLM